MLSYLNLDAQFRSLTSNTFSSKNRFGRRTIIYGHNGSGKSSLSELLYQVADGKQSIPVTWHNTEGQKSVLSPHSMVPNVVISSFCKSWMRENVADFLDGNSAAAIVALGKTAKEAQEQEKLLNSEIIELEEKKPEAHQDWKSAKQAVNAVVRGVQDAIEGTLRDVDHRKFTKNRYNDPKVRELLSDHTKPFPNEDEHRKNLDSLQQGELDLLEVSLCPSPDWAQLAQSARTLLSSSVQSEVIKEILGNKSLQQWLEEGLALHREESSCQFCKNSLPRERLNELERHFDESRRIVQNQVASLREEIAAGRKAVDSWWQDLPKVEHVYPELAAEFLGSLERESDVLAEINRAFEVLDEILSEKFDAPERTDLRFDIAIPGIAGECIKELCDRHDALASKAEERKQETALDVLDFLVGSQASSYCSLRAREDETHEEYLAVIDDLKTKEELVKIERAKQFSSKEMADQISHDLEVVYGRHYLSIEVSPDGKNYRCTRDGLPAEHLSEGERNTLALIYFLRHLEDEEHNVAPERRLVIIDDPSSSLDREAVFATHSWLLRSLEKYAQTIILTHDFEMLRLFLNSQKNQLTSHRDIVRRGSKTEATAQEKAKKQAELLYPKIAFLEMHIKAGPGKSRYSLLKPLSETFLNFRSEYHFLFDRLLRGIEQPDDHELLFLLPNAARRVLESFAAFHVPGRSQFEQQLKKIALEDQNEEYRDVYDFCNRFSHGEGREPLLALDATTISQQIARCLELLKVSAPEHFEAMCKAVGRKDHDPLTSTPW